MLNGNKLAYKDWQSIVPTQSTQSNIIHQIATVKAQKPFD